MHYRRQPYRVTLAVGFLSLIFGIVASPAPGQSPSALTASDYSYARPEEVVVRHLTLDITVDFKKRQLKGTAQYEIENKGPVTRLILDTKDLAVLGVTLGRGNAPTDFDIGPRDQLLGAPLTIVITPETRLVTVEYSTTSNSEALQWLSPSQTSSKKAFLYTHSQPILARSWIPCQDRPDIRMTYRATVRVPRGTMALMSAINPQKGSSSGRYEFDMPQPIPSYLMALAAGTISFRPTGKRSGVYAEPTLVSRAAKELDGVERMLAAAEALYGPYRWGRYDVLILPPAYPLGGMENPRLTFATPTILAGDKSLTNLIAHELAHSWSGNLVTNASWDDVWLNESFTTYVERRIVESVYGKDVADMQAVNGRHDLDDDIRRLGPTAPETQLHLELHGRDPMQAGREIVYEKGALFLRRLEDAVGRRRWDAFLRTYFDKFGFQNVTTKKFVAYFTAQLAERDSVLQASVNINEWINGQGLPSDAPLIRSSRFERVEEQFRSWQTGHSDSPLKTAGWRTEEWLHFLHLIPDSTDHDGMNRLDQACGFSKATNAEILATWSELAIRHKYREAFPAVEAFLLRVGRIKYLYPIYSALAASEETREWGKEIFKKARKGYHPIAVQAVEEVLGAQ